MFKNFHWISFGAGVASGILLLLLVVGGMRLVSPPRQRGFGGTGSFQSGGGPNLARMADRFGMTQAELQQELDAGKTMQQIAQEHGVTFGGGGRRQQNSNDSGATLSSSAAAVLSGASMSVGAATLSSSSTATR